jgi:hypothetical protein
MSFGSSGPPVRGFQTFRAISSLEAPQKFPGRMLADFRQVEKLLQKIVSEARTVALSSSRGFVSTEAPLRSQRDPLWPSWRVLVD